MITVFRFVQVFPEQQSFHRKSEHAHELDDLQRSIDAYNNEYEMLRTWNDSCDITIDCVRTLKEYIYKGKQTMLEKDESGFIVCKSENGSKRAQSGPREYSQPVIPNIAHYIWFGCNVFRFDHLIVVLSAYRVMKADEIMFHTDCEPNGVYWEEAKHTIPVLAVKERKVPSVVFNNSLKKSEIYHKSDIIRLQVLMQYGGVYMDNDVIVVNSLEPLRHFDSVLGREDPTRLNNGIILARKNSLFIKLYHDAYQIYNRFCWNCDSIQFPNTLAAQCPHLIHIDRDHLVKPGVMATEVIFENQFPWWRNHFTIHTWIRWYFDLPKNENKTIDFNSENIKTLNTSYGEMCRFVYYGSKDIIK
ncbi:uncharacterized protein LOC144439422 [Glandiceps talaboti]